MKVKNSFKVLIGVYGFALLLAGCPKTEPKEPADLFRPLPRAPGLRSFSETQPYTAVTAYSGMLYAGTPSGLVRFDERTKRFVRITAKEGLSGDRVTAMSGHHESGLWIGTDRGLSNFKGSSWKSHKINDPPGSISALVATSWGVWAGGAKGLARFKDGAWRPFLPGARVSIMQQDLSGDGVWVGTDGEGLYHFEGGKFVSHNPVRGQVIRRVVAMTYTEDGGVLVVGQDGKKRYRLVFFDGTHWTSYSLHPHGQLGWVHQIAGSTMLAYQDRVLLLKRIQRTPQGKVKLPAGPVRLEGTPAPKAPQGYPFPLFYTEPMTNWLPPDPTIVSGQGRQMLIATRTIGLVRYDGKQATWYRTNELTREGEKLKVACDARACFLAGADGRGHRFDGKGFKAVSVSSEPGTTVQSFINDPSGAVVAVHSPLDGRSLVFSRLVAGTESKFDRQREVKIAIPPGEVEVRFARYSPDGQLWVGLRYMKDGRYPWGVVVIDSAGKTMYHRSTLLSTETRLKGSLALPDDIRDVQFIEGYIWLATGAGACRVQGNQVTLFTENEGLASELVHRFERSSDGELLLASHGGVGRLAGKEWRFDFAGPMSQASRALLRDGPNLWVGTSVGLVLRRDGKDRVLTTRTDGLAGDVVLDLYRDPGGRLWVLTDQGLSIIEPSFGR